MVLDVTCVFTSWKISLSAGELVCVQDFAGDMRNQGDEMRISISDFNPTTLSTSVQTIPDFQWRVLG